MDFENQFAKISKNYFILPNVAKAPICTFNFTIPTEKVSHLKPCHLHYMKFMARMRYMLAKSRLIFSCFHYNQFANEITNFLVLGGKKLKIIL